MGYDLKAKTEGVNDFHFGAFSYGVLLEQCGWYFACSRVGVRWQCVFGLDSRMPQGDTYPRLISNDGFEVTEEEARVMARVALNYCAWQDVLLENGEDPEAAMPAGVRFDSREHIIRKDFVEKYREFAAWAVKSGGFSIH